MTSEERATTEPKSEEATAPVAATDEDATSKETFSVTRGPILEASDVSRSFGEVDVLSDVSLSLDSGAVTTIIGPNGSGKTTLLRVLTGVLAPSEGTVTYHGPERERERGYLPQQPAFRPGFSARETLAFYTSLVSGDPDALLERVGLGEAGDRRVEALSGGMRRLLGIAQATVGDPPVVLLDEPGSGLDPGMGRRTFEVVRELADDGTAVLVTSHDMGLTEQFSDRIALLERGGIRATGTPDELYAEYGCDSLQDVFDTVLDRRDGSVDVLGTDSTGTATAEQDREGDSA